PAFLSEILSCQSSHYGKENNIELAKGQVNLEVRMQNLELFRMLRRVLIDIEWLIQFVCQISRLRCAPLEMTPEWNPDYVGIFF
ncbi:MAG: hypothetical protein WBC22_07945, partial [Sedimentisphaerales bacterium]